MAFDHREFLPHGVSFLVRVYDVMNEGVVRAFAPRSCPWAIGEPVAHTFPHESVPDVASRIGEAAWMGAVDNMGLGLR